MSKQNRSYTNDFKREAIVLAMDSSSIVSAARSSEIPEIVGFLDLCEIFLK